jgi:phosphotransferase system HPr-like phosphotransfer protein
MRETRIRLGIDDVIHFVRAAETCNFDVDVNYNRVFVDAKSILGVLSLDLGRVLTVKCHGENLVFEQFLQQYAVV